MTNERPSALLWTLALAAVLVGAASAAAWIHDLRPAGVFKLVTTKAEPHEGVFYPAPERLPPDALTCDLGRLLDATPAARPTKTKRSSPRAVRASR